MRTAHPRQVASHCVTCQNRLSPGEDSDLGALLSLDALAWRAQHWPYLRPRHRTDLPILPARALRGKMTKCGGLTIDLLGSRWQSPASHPQATPSARPVRDREYPRELLAGNTQPCAGRKHGGEDGGGGSTVSPRQSGDVARGKAAHDVSAYQEPVRGHRR